MRVSQSNCEKKPRPIKSQLEPHRFQDDWTRDLYFGDPLRTLKSGRFQPYFLHFAFFYIFRPLFCTYLAENGPQQQPEHGYHRVERVSCIGNYCNAAPSPRKIDYFQATSS